jgi:hypothetical protein
MQATNTNMAQQGDNGSYEQRNNIRILWLIKVKTEKKHFNTKHTLKLLNIIFIYKESEKGKENSSRVAFPLKTLTTTTITKVNDKY